MAASHGAVKKSMRRTDLKICDYDTFRSVVDKGEDYVFSVHPQLLADKRFVADMDGMYGEPCKYEMW